LADKAQIKTTIVKNTLYIHLSGCWRSLYINQIEPDLTTLDISHVKKCIVNLSDIASVDTIGASILKSFLRQLEHNHIKVTYLGETSDLESLWSQLGHTISPTPKASQKQNFIRVWLSNFGQNIIITLENFIDFISFLGCIVLIIVSTLKNPQKLRFTSFLVFLERGGLQALPIIGIISFLIGIVLIHQGAFQLKRFGAEIYAIDLLAISMLREVGILLTAIVVAGRSGSAFAAQIGTMKLNQEIDVMQTLGLNPIEVLVLPRLLSLMIALPLLAFYADIMGLLGGGFIATFVLGLSFEQFLSQLKHAFSLWSFWIGIIKAPIFAFFIALVGCYEGMQVSQGAESVGLRTTQSVVKGIFLVIILNAAFSVLFTYIGI
jgi:phospholipid/cholesterol/gamma-HCH transport system permease protein